MLLKWRFAAAFVLSVVLASAARANYVKLTANWSEDNGPFMNFSRPTPVPPLTTSSPVSDSHDVTENRVSFDLSASAGYGSVGAVANSYVTPQFLTSTANVEALARYSDTLTIKLAPAAQTLVRGANLAATVYGSVKATSNPFINATAAENFTLSGGGTDTAIDAHSTPTNINRFFSTIKVGPGSSPAPGTFFWNFDLSLDAQANVSAGGGINASANSAAVGQIDGYELLDGSGKIVTLPPGSVTVTSASGSSYSDMADEPGQLMGDANLDGKVDFADLVALARNYGKTGTWMEGDFDGDGTIDFTDLVDLARNYGGTVPAVAQLSAFDPAFRADVQAAFATVPEPSAAATLLILTLLLAIRRRRKITHPAL